MLNPIRACTRCGEQHRRRHAWCSDCAAAYMREWRSTRPAYPTEEARLRANARSYANVYLRRGLLTRGPCEDCGVGHDDEPVQMHHHDYSKPLDVTWLCAPCHRARHDDPDEYEPVLVVPRGRPRNPV